MANLRVPSGNFNRQVPLLTSSVIGKSESQPHWQVNCQWHTKSHQYDFKPNSSINELLPELRMTRSPAPTLLI